MTKILVIEDAAMLRGEIAEWLTLEGYEVLSAEDGAAGIACALRETPDLILSDIMMPYMDGYGVLLTLRSNLATATIPFIFMTARASPEDIRRGMITGADDYIVKPFARLDLLESIRARLEKKAISEHANQSQVEQLQKALGEEHERRLLNAKMVAMFSHDFRNPLTTILSSVGIVRDYSERIGVEGRNKQLNRVEASVQHLLKMLDDMLLYSQIDSGRLIVNRELLDVGQYIERIADEFRAIYGETHTILFENHISEDILSDPRLLNQIATNLISNALKYSPSGSEVRVQVEPEDHQYKLSVTDQGIGISDADRVRLFSPFQRGSNVQGKPGTGLGLAIVQQAVDLLGGTIRLESTVGVGTSIHVLIPISAA